jgi:hypothetical protein
MSRNSTSAIYKSTYYLGIVYVKFAAEQEFHRVSTYSACPMQMMRLKNLL